MTREIPERFRWAVELLDVRPDEQVLEVGCGYGHMIGLICKHLTIGHITAIDRSAAMVQAAIRNNRRHIDSGNAEIIHQDLLGSKLPSASFDKAFLFNINAFWMDPISEMAEVKRVLKPGGEFFIFHQPPPEHEIGEFVERFESNLTKNGFEIVSAKVDLVEGKEMTCVESQPSLR